MSDVDAIVLDIDGGSMLEECLASIEGAARIVVLDNGSRVPTKTTCAEVIRSEKNLGFAAGANAAYRATTAPFVALINNDVVLDPGWMAAVRAAMDRDPKLAAVQTIIRRPDGRIDGAGIDISDGTFRQIGSGQHVGTDLGVA
ncbi:MAG TPA: glycosyltransferase, partial [Thermoanaerobaculia bacterium]|nr:glycosyltransferase [Thermoanaerobaculia bacterium]